MIINLNYLFDSFVKLDAKWQALLTAKVDLITNIDQKLMLLAQNYIIYPPKEYIFRALEYVSPDNVRVVILGQDPYHGINQANGLAFAVNDGVAMPPSLKNILKELANEYPDASLNGIGGDLLVNWALQGVLLLNSSLAVIENQPNSLQNIGFQIITDDIIKYLSSSYNHIIFILWGAFAIKKARLIDQEKHHVLISTHPSPLSAHRGFLGCNHFRLCNEYLVQHKKDPIDWVKYNN